MARLATIEAPAIEAPALAEPALEPPPRAFLRALVLPSEEPAAALTTNDELTMVRMGLSVEELGPGENREVLGAAIEQVYARLEAHRGLLPSVWLASQSPQSGTRFDALLAEPPSDEAPALGVVFLHGYGGNFTWPCASVADAASEVGATTICPSLGPEGDWWSAEGPSIVDASIAALERRGIRRIVLAGLSNGGIGASRLGARFADRISGLLLVSGAARGTSTTLPSLVLHGTRDRMAPSASARAFVRASPNAELEMLEGGHFILAENEAAIHERIAVWLTRFR